MDLEIEKSYWKKGYKNVVGLDEAGRGPLAGPVYAASVVIIYYKIMVQKEFLYMNFIMVVEIWLVLNLRSVAILMRRFH